MNETYLSHHGILGQKWGVRRYQNKDGSYTEAGRERYGKALAEGIKKADVSGTSANDTIAKVHDSLRKNKAVNRFNMKSKTWEELAETRLAIEDENRKLNIEINEKLSKEFGKPFNKLSGDQQIAYYVRGMELAKERGTTKEYQELVTKWDRLSKQYEKECSDFLDDLLGEYGKTPLKSGWAVKYNFVTKEISKQTVKDLAAIEMLRRAGGKI